MMSKVIAGIVMMLAMSSALAQIVPSQAADFLAIDKVQQAIYYNRWLDANRKLVNECMPGWSDEQLLDYYDNWLQDNPQYFHRNLTLTFSQSMMLWCGKAK